MIQVLVRWAVPVFVMISGFLLLNPDKEMPLIKIRKYTLRMVTVLLTFGYAYCLIETFAENGLTDIPMSLMLSAKNLIEGKSWAHMWYVYMLIGLYLLTPMLRIFVKHADERIMRWTLVMLFLLTVARPTVSKWTGIEISLLLPITSPYLFYYLMGGYLFSHSLSRKAAKLMLLFGGIGVAVMQMTAAKGSVEAAPPDNMFVALYAIGLFSWAKESRTMERMAQNGLISSVSKYSFGIYLVHPVFLNLLNKGLHITPAVFPILIGELSFFFAALIGAYAASWAITKIAPIRGILQ